MKKYDAIVIGGGPAGMTAALYMARFGVNLAVVEKVTPGGLLLQTSNIENYPGIPDVQGYALADAMQAQLGAYQYTTYHAEVMDFKPDPGKNSLLIGEEWVEARTVIICSGVRYRKLGLPREEEFAGKGISYCALCDGNFFRGLVVGVVGGGNSALEESLYLSRLVKELHIFHRRDAFRADKICQDKIANVPNIHIHTSTVVTELQGNELLTGVTLCNVKTNESITMPLDGIFLFTGFKPNSDIFAASLNVDEAGFIMTDLEMRCSLPGIFAAGDVRSKLCRQIATAVGDGATAANAAHAYLEHTNA